MHSFIRKQDIINNQNAQTFSDLKDTLAKIAFALTIQEKRKFPALRLNQVSYNSS